MEQCNISSPKQKWVCTERSLEQQGTRVKNKGTLNFTSDWIKPNDSSYFKNCGQQIYSYRGNVYCTPAVIFILSAYGHEGRLPLKADFQSGK